MKKASILNVSENRISSVDIITIFYPSSSTSSSISIPAIPTTISTSVLSPQLQRQTDLTSNNSMKSINSRKSNQTSLKVSPSSSVLIPTPYLYNQLMYLNISSNLLLSLYGIQCCPHLKVQ